jgi:hypothetical protein
MPEILRREFLKAVASLPALVSLGSGSRSPTPWLRAEWRSSWRRESSVAAALRSGQKIPPGVPQGLAPGPAPSPLAARFRDLERRFVFEYYPWYGREPWRHWDEAGRNPPHDLATEYVPRLGAYDSRVRDLIEQHARWIAASGAGSISLSWWGERSYEDRCVHHVMVSREVGASASGIRGAQPDRKYAPQGRKTVESRGFRDGTVFALLPRSWKL